VIQRDDRITRMIFRIKNIIKQYPRQFWLVTLVMLLAWLFHSLMWSYLMLYISQRMGQPLSSVSGLMAVNAVTGMVTTFLGGAIADKFGRKGVMVFSLLFCGVGWFFFRIAGTLPIYALLMAVTGATTPLYRLASDSMVSDLVPPEQRLDAYSMLRMGNNIGVAIGPAIGGYLASISYNISFTVIGIGLVSLSVAGAFLFRETKPADVSNNQGRKAMLGGYSSIFKDRVFMKILIAFSLIRIGTSILWLMLAAYTKQNFGLSENVFGFIPTTNALMVIFMQMMVTRRTSRLKPESAMVLGALFYAVSIFGIFFANGFWGFWICMVGSTIGEMILLPTTTTYTSRLAPPDMRARYMSLYTLTTGIGSGLGPLLGGIMADIFGARSMWFAAGMVEMIGFFVFLLVALQQRRMEKMDPVRTAGEV